MPQTSTASAQGTFRTETEQFFQISDGPNNGVSTPASRLLFFLPDPDSATAGSEFITAGGAGTWTVRIYELDTTGSTLGAQIYANTVAAGNNVHYVALDPAVFIVANTRQFRAILSDEGGNQIEEWDFGVYNHTSVGGAANVADANNKLARIAILLGYRQKVIYSDYLNGTPRTQTIQGMAADLSTVLATYTRKITHDSAGHILGEVCVADDTNVL